MRTFENGGWLRMVCGPIESKNKAGCCSGESVRFEVLEQRLMFDTAAAVEVDPPDRLMNSVVLAEWNTPGQFEGWQVDNGADVSVSGGSLTAQSPVGAVNPLQVDLENISAGPDLDFGYFDYLQTRLLLPSGHDEAVTFSFGTSTNGGFAANRTFEIPADQIAQDGGWHTYRLDLGLETWWRDSLEDLRIEPLGDVGAGDYVSIDYMEVGDLPGDVLLVNTNLNIMSGETFGDLGRLESKHFAIWWSPSTDAAFDPNAHGRRALRMLEESYQVYYKLLGYDEPFENTNPALRDGNRYKTNHTTWYGGYWMGSKDGFTYLNVGESGLRDEGWGNPVPHEYAHCVQGAQQGFLVGQHWESHANYLRENRTYAFAEQFPSDGRSTLDMRPFELSNLRQDHGRLIYGDFRIHMALQDYADELGIDPNTAAQLWKEGSKDWTVYEKLETLLPPGVSVQDVVGTTMRYWPLLDFDHGAEMQGKLWTNAEEKATYEHRTGSMLIPSADKPGWYRVPFEKAPEKFAYTFHELTPSSSTITVEFRGMDLIGGDEDWRWSLAAVDDAGNTRYSNVWSPGAQSFALEADEHRVLLVVVPTPDDISLDPHSNHHNRKPTDKHPDRLHYAYEVRIVGAAPSTHQLDYARGAGHYHANGGGWVDNSAIVSAIAYVGPNARVLDSARVYDNARIEDYAVVADSARVENNAVVSGYAAILDNARIQENARVRDRGIVERNAVIRGNAIVEDYARVEGGTVVEDSAIARGSSWSFGGVLSGTAIVDYDYSFDFSFNDGVHFSHVPWGGWYFDNFSATQKMTRGLVASYRTEAAEGEVFWDEFGAQHAILRGAPGRVEDADMNSRVLELNGSDQYVVVDRSLADLGDASFALWLKPTTSDAAETLLYFGSSPDTYMKLTGRNAAGRPELTISVDGAVEQLVATQNLNVDEWTHLVVTFDGATAKLYMNGAPAGQAAVSVVPRDVLGPNDYQSGEHLYAGRDAAGDFFQGRLEDIRFYNATLTQNEVNHVHSRAGAKLGEFYAETPMVFDGASTTAESGVHNGLVRTLAAWINPTTSGDVSYYEPIVDSNDEREGSYRGSGIGLDNGKIKVRLDGTGFWNTNVPVQTGQWQHVAVAFDGSVARLYVDGSQQAERSYSASEDNLAGKNYRIGWGQEDEGSTPTYFHGEIRDLEIYDRMVVISDWHGPNVPPSAVDDNATTTESVAVNIPVLLNDTDPDGDTLDVVSFTQGTHGAVFDNGDGTLRYFPTAGYIGSDTFQYTADDGFEGTSTATVNVVVVDPATPPAAAHHWKFDEGSGVAAADSSGSAHGTLTNMSASIAWINGKDDGALSFDGSNDYVATASLISGALGGTSSLTFWIRTTQSGNDTAHLAPGVTGVEQSGGGNDVFWGWLDASGRIGVQAGNVAGARSDQPVNDGTWHHVALTRNSASGTVQVYVDGVLQQEVASDTGAKSTGFASIGRIEDTGGTPEYLQGQLDDVRVFPNVISLEEVVDVMLDVTPPSSQEPVAISITLGGARDGDDLAPTDTAGAYPAQYWNDLTSTSAAVSSDSLVDSNGDVEVITFSASAQGLGQYNAVGNPNLNVMSSFMASGRTDPNDPDVIDIRIEDIPYAQYDLYIYDDSYANFRSPWGDSDFAIPAFLLTDGIGGAEIDTWYGQNQTDFRNVQIYAEFTTTDLSTAEARGLAGSPGSPVGNDNYVLIQGLTAADLQIIGYKGSSLAFDGAGVNAIQIVGTPVETVVAEVVDRHIFYNNSAFDGGTPADDPLDDQAIDPGVEALRPGGTASSANYTSDSRGINGVMVDISGLINPDDVDLLTFDSYFQFRVGNGGSPDGWTQAPDPTIVRARQGDGDIQRVTIIWDDDSIRNEWLEVTVPANNYTGLADPDVFYFANLVGDTNGDRQVSASDYDALVGDFGRSGGIGALAADLNSDGRTDLTDLAIMRDNFGNMLPDAIPGPAAAPQSAAEPIAAAAAPIVQFVSQPIRQAHGEPVDEGDGNDGLNAIIASAPDIDLLVVSPAAGSYISGRERISSSSPATAPHLAATTEYDLRPLADDPDGDQADDLLEDILAESPLAVPL